MTDTWQEVDMTDVSVRAKDGGICTYCGEHYELMGMAIRFIYTTDIQNSKVRLICVKCLIEAFDNALVGRRA